MSKKGHAGRPAWPFFWPPAPARAPTRPPIKDTSVGSRVGERAGADCQERHWSGPMPSNKN